MSKHSSPVRRMSTFAKRHVMVMFSQYESFNYYTVPFCLSSPHVAIRHNFAIWSFINPLRCSDLYFTNKIASTGGKTSYTNAICHLALLHCPLISNTRSPTPTFSFFSCHFVLINRFEAKYFIQHCQN